MMREDMDECKRMVFETLTGRLCQEYQMPGIENAYAPGAFCMERYCCVRDAYDSLCARLGVEDEDADVETIIHCFLDIEKYIGLRMFEYGVYYGSSGKLYSQFLSQLR